MNRRTFILAVPAFATGCSAPPNSTFVPPTPASLQQALLNACGFSAEIGPLATLIAQFVPVPGVSTTATVLNQLTSQVCAQVMPTKLTPQAVAGGTVAVQVNNVTVVGHFLR